MFNTMIQCNTIYYDILLYTTWPATWGAEAAGCDRSGAEPQRPKPRPSTCEEKGCST